MRDRVFYDARWWAGIPMAERREGLPGHGQVPPARAASPAQARRGEKRLRALRHDPITPGRDFPLEPWCQWLGVTQDQLIWLLGETAESLRRRLPEPPTWLRTVAEAWRCFPGAPFPAQASGTTDGPGDSTQSPAAVADRALLNWIGPLVAWARQRLRARVTPVTAGPLPQSHALFAPDSARLLGMVKWALAVELNGMRQAGRLRGRTSAGRFADFAERLADRDAALDLLATYPVLARDLVTQLQQWIEVRAEFAARLTSDLPALRARFGVAGETIRDVRDIAFGAGDFHRGGRSVAIVTFSGGGRVVYKPRDLDVEDHFNQILGWVNEHGLRCALRQSDILVRPGYGWCAFADPAPCQDAGEVARFYWRQGAYLALFYALRCYDMHFENLIAVGEHPSYIDLEAMFHAEPSAPAPAIEADEQAAWLPDCVLAVGLLPQRIVEIDETGMRTMEMSGLAGGLAPGELDIRSRIGFADDGTDRMRLVRERPAVPATGNQPVLHGERVDPRSMEPDLIAGFRDCYWLILTRCDELLRPDGLLAAFKDDNVRTVLRNTYHYNAMLDECWNPSLLRDSADREYALECLAADPAHALDHPAITASERRQLAMLDVPFFATTPESTAVRDGQGQLAASFFRQTGMQAVRRRLGKFSAEDLERQMWFVRASLATRHCGGHAQHPDRPPRPLPRDEISEDLALAAASRIGDELLRTAARNDSGASDWLSLNLLGERIWVVGWSGLGLYSGVTGIALFLAELGAATGDARYKGLAEDVVAAVADPAEMPETEALRGMSVGGYQELAGTVYLLARLGVAWAAPSLLDVAQQLVPAIAQNLADDPATDIVSGAAGAALALICLAQAAPAESTLAAIRRCGEVLLAGSRAQRPDHDVPAHPLRLAVDEPAAGFARGLAGQAYALAAIADLTGEARFAAASVRVLELERTRFGTAVSGPQRAAGTSCGRQGQEGRERNAWCSGMAGIVLAGAGIENFNRTGGRRRWRSEPRETAAIHRDLLGGVGNDSLCHGTFCLTEALHAGAEAAGDTESARIADRAAAAVARRVLAAEVVTGVPSGVWSPGLMDGAAGVGYGLLRAALRDRVPNVLLLRGG